MALRVLCLYLTQPQDVQPLAEIFYRATPQIMGRGQEALLLEISKCQALYRETTFLARTRVTLRRIGVDARLAVADDVGSALGMALFRCDSKAQLPIETLAFYVDPWARNEELKKDAVEMAKTLRLMGVRSIGDFLALPIRELASRFSQLGLLAYMRAHGQSPVVWEPFTPRQDVHETFEFDQEAPAENLQPVYFRLQPMLERLVLRLRAQGLRPRQLDVRIRQEHATRHETHQQERRIRLVLQLPFISSKVMLQIAREKIETHVRHEPLRARICEIGVAAIETVPYAETQKDIFNQKKEETEESFFQLVSRVATRLGGGVFFAKPQASYLPEKNWRPVNEITSGVAATAKDTAKSEAQPQVVLPERPLRLLPKPVPLQLLRVFGSSRWRVVGPDFSEEVQSIASREVLHADWWDAGSPLAGLERVYFHMLTKDSGRRLWVFRSRAGHFLHGVFE